MYFYLSKILAPFLNLVNFLIFFIVFLYFLNLRIKKKYIKYLINFLIIIFVSLIFFPIGKKGMFYLEKDYFIQEELNKIDNILVLAGPENPTTTNITSKLNIGDGSERLIASVKIALDNPSSKIFFLGGDGKLVKSKFNEADVAKIFYNDVGFDLNRVKFFDNTRNTVENLQAFQNLQNENKSNILITSAFHMKRAMLIAQKLDLEVTPYAVDFRSNLSSLADKKNKFSIINYIQSFDLIKNLSPSNTFFREILGILAFKIFY